LQSAERDATSPSQYRREFQVDFTASVDDVLIPQDLVQQAMERYMGGVNASALRTYPKTLGVDLARHGADSTVFFPRWGPQALKPIVIENSDLMYVVGKLSHLIDRWHPDATFVDVGGLGAGVVDRMRQLGYMIVDVNFGQRATDERFSDMRSQMWFGMREWLQSGGILPDDPALPAEMTSPTFAFDARNKIRLERKADLKKRTGRSPDRADALALTFAMPVAAPELPWEYAERPPVAWRTPEATSHNYDPFDQWK
jgi:hypothetical protein